MFNSFDFGGGSINSQSIFNQSIALGSQIVSAIGKRPTTQIAANAGGVFALPNPNVDIAESESKAFQAQAFSNAQLAASGKTSKKLDTPGGALDGFVDFLTKNPTTTLLIGVGLFLLFRQPPGKK